MFMEIFYLLLFCVYDECTCGELFLKTRYNVSLPAAWIVGCEFESSSLHGKCFDMMNLSVTTIILISDCYYYKALMSIPVIQFYHVSVHFLDTNVM